MQQLTFDAAYKFALWSSLFCEAKGNPKGDAERDANNACVRFIAFTLIRESLPRRGRKSCCLSGACGRASLTHKRVHIGRSEIHPTYGERDDVCQCLAHATMCVGQPVDLLLRNYNSSTLLIGDRYAGLQCMLRHMFFRSVTFSGIPNPQDAQRVINELGKTFGYGGGKVRHLSLGGIPACVTVTPLLLLMASTDMVTQLRLEDCGIQDVTDVVHYIRASKRLRRLSLRGNHGISGGMMALGLAVATCDNLLSIDIGLCGLNNEHLRVFLTHLHEFARRGCFDLDLSNNCLGEQFFMDIQRAPPAFRETLSILNISGHNFGNCGDSASSMLLELPALRGILLNQCDLETRDLQRLCKVLAQRDRAWIQVSFRDNSFTAHDLKRVALISFAVNSHFCVAGNDIGSNIRKLNLTLVLPFLRELDLSLCNIGDEGVAQLASSLEKVELFNLCILRLDGNDIGAEKTKGIGGLQFLGRALRAGCAPSIKILSLAHNRLSLRPLLTLVEQVSSTLRELHISYSSVANDDNQMADLVGRIVRRQKSGNAFGKLDIWALREKDVGVPSGVALFASLEAQVALRVVLEAN